MMNLDKVEARILEIEREVTDIQLKGYTDSGEVWRIGPSSVMDCVRLNDLRRELEDITDGENTLHVNHRGQFHPVCRIPLEAGKGWYRDWADHLTRNADTQANKVIAPFMRNGIVRKEFFVDKYKLSAIYTAQGGSSHTNYSVGLYGMAPAHTGGGFTVSYNGTVDEVAALNSATLPPFFPSSMLDLVHDKHMITWDEYGYLCLLMMDQGWQCTGNSSQGRDTSGRSGVAAPYQYAGYNPHTLNGSGPRQWRHNGRFTGVADLVGGCRVILSGVKVGGGMIQQIDFASLGDMTAADLKDTGTHWQAISTTGEGYVDVPTVEAGGAPSGVYCIDFTETPTASSQKATMISDTVTIRDQSYYGAVAQSAVTLKGGLTSDWRLELAVLYPFKSGALDGTQFLRNAEGTSFVLLAGGDWGSGADAGPGYLSGDSAFSGAYNHIGGLLASD